MIASSRELSAGRSLEGGGELVALGLHSFAGGGRLPQALFPEFRIAPRTEQATVQQIAVSQKRHGEAAVGEERRVPPALGDGFDQGVSVGRRGGALQERGDPDQAVVAEAVGAEAAGELRGAAGRVGDEIDFHRVDFRRSRRPGDLQAPAMPFGCIHRGAALQPRTPTPVRARRARRFRQAGLEAAAVDVPACAVGIGEEGILGGIGRAPEGAVALGAQVSVPFQERVETEVAEEGREAGREGFSHLLRRLGPGLQDEGPHTATGEDEGGHRAGGTAAGEGHPRLAFHRQR